MGHAGCEPLPGAVLDVWHADGSGAYGPGLRARFHAADDGSWTLRTVMPGPYAENGVMRPAHVHLRVTADRHAPLTTQLFFEGDPYLPGDPHVRPGLVRPCVRESGGLACRFDIVLRRLTGW